MMRRGRPLRRAAVVGGVAAVAHNSGKKSAQAQAAEQAQNQQIADLQAQQDYQAQQNMMAQQQAAPAPVAPAPAPAPGFSDDMVAQLTSLKGLLDAGVLTEAEFDAQKQKILAGS